MFAWLMPNDKSCSKENSSNLPLVNKFGTCLYLNSGDWVENLTSLEYHKGKWNLEHFQKENYEKEVVSTEEDLSEIQNLVAAITITSKQ